MYTVIGIGYLIFEMDELGGKTKLCKGSDTIALILDNPVIDIISKGRIAAT